mgnify:FL=1
MLRTAAGVSECLPSAARFILSMDCERPFAWIFCACAGPESMAGVWGLLAQLVDLGVFDGLCEEVETAESTWKFNTAQF